MRFNPAFFKWINPPCQPWLRVFYKIVVLDIFVDLFFYYPFKQLPNHTHQTNPSVITGLGFTFL